MSMPTPPIGTPATIGARLAAFTIDVAVVAVLATVAGLLWSSAVLAAFVAAEVVLALWIVQARWGVGPGAALLRLRVSRTDAPFSPGAGRAFVRGSIVGIGGLVFLIGAWVVQASAVWDRTGRRRSWADKAAQTIVVAVPRRDRVAQAADGAYALATPTVLGRSSIESGRAADVGRQQALAPAPPIAPAWGSPPPPLPLSAPAPQPSTALPAPADAAGLPAAAETASPSLPGAQIPGGQLLLAFDTGQREQLPLPVTVNLGRNPVATEPGDALIVVTDPDRLISKTHLRLEHDGESAWVTDAGSTNGSELVDDDGRGRVLAAGVRTRLDDGVRVRLGERIFTVSRLIGGTP
ncbi:FHA domain-containing protein [Microbacterium sp. P04]|uniref:FHA domain-containing protein n=1 Tax=Microbacterium sp. P04 TaxID=3366947 RepID=UPI0037452B28